MTTLHGHVALAKRREAVRRIPSSVLLVPDPDQRPLEKLNDRRDDLRARHSGEREIVCRPLSDERQRGAERRQASVLHLVAQLAPARVIPVLLSVLRIPTRGLDMTERAWTDPYGRPRGGNGERANAAKLRGLAHARAPWSDIGKTKSRAPSDDARSSVTDVLKTGGSSRTHGVGRERGQELKRRSPSCHAGPCLRPRRVG
jgi:hypothetical protein